MADNGEVVGDEQIGQAILFLQIEQQVDDLPLIDVERRNGLVADDEFRLAASAGQWPPLVLAARQLVRVATRSGRKADIA